MIRFLTLAILALGLFNGVAYAEESSIYSPDYCEFTATFPEEPYIARKCDDATEKRCYNEVSFTQVFDLDTTVNFKVICNKISNEVYETYSGRIMEATLKAMTEGTVVKTFDTTFREEEKYKQAGLVGEGKVGRTPTIYIAQLWIGKKSAMSVQAELIGDSDEDADKLFSDVLRSIGLKGKDNQKTPEDEAPEAEEEDKSG